MNKRNFFASLIALTGLISSCKKEDVIKPIVTTTPTTATRQLARIEAVGSGYTTTFTYDAQGRLKSYANPSFVVENDYTGGTFKQTVNRVGFGKAYTYDATSMAGNQVTGLLCTSFRADGSINYTEPISFQYTQAGKQAGKGYGSYIYTQEVTGGNTTRMSVTSNGNFHAETIYEFYTDKLNTFNVNWLEYCYEDQMMNSTDVFGKKNANLLKKVSYRSNTGTNVSEFSYGFDAAGNITTMSVKYSKDGGTPVLTEYNVSYF